MDTIDAPQVVIENVSFTVRPGSFVAIVGPSGSGKSTLAALAARLFDPTSGRIFVGGVDLREIPEPRLVTTVGLVTQDTLLFHDTIRENLLLAKPDATDKELVRACVAAGIHQFVRSLPAGYGTLVGERGVRLSGGQRQRIAFARMVLRDPSIIILDEATAHLDAESESLLREAIESVLAGRTRVVIAHRLSTIVDADEILVVEHGRIVERGTHAELLDADGRYRRLYRTQLLSAEEEVADVAP
jgi:ATP-binding cassette subfamily B protein